MLKFWPLLALVLSGLMVEEVSAARQRYVPKWKKQACEIPSSQNEHSHYICDDDGDVKCLPGWQGDLCDVPICRKGCDPQQGYCNRPGECRCKLGFYGERCDRCIPLPGCQNGGCNVSFECVCQPGWDGLFCSEPICRSDCHQTRGYCEQPGECKCRLGWSGATCKECQVLPGCQHGTCTKPLECKCHAGYTGLLCHLPICSSTCHKERGYCRRPGECRCKVGWTGDDCSKCFPYPGCKNGDCRRPWECNCRPGWGGILCDEKLNYCEDHPNTCENGGKCTSLIKDDGYFRCECPSGYRGKTCQTLPAMMVAAIAASANATSTTTTTIESSTLSTTEASGSSSTSVSVSSGQPAKKQQPSKVKNPTTSSKNPLKPVQLTVATAQTNSMTLAAMMANIKHSVHLDDAQHDDELDNEA